MQIMKHRGVFFSLNHARYAHLALFHAETNYNVLCDSFVSVFHPPLTARSHVLISDLQVKSEVTTLRNTGIKWEWAEEEIRVQSFSVRSHEVLVRNELCFGPMIIPEKQLYYQVWSIASKPLDFWYCG